jgi:septum formation protein
LPREELILASASPRRRQILADMGVRFRVQPCSLLEPADKPAGIAPTAWAEALAYFKASAVARNFVNSVVLGADTVVACGGQLLGKPSDRGDAERMLKLQSACASEVITGCCVLTPNQGDTRALAHEVTTVWMRDSHEQRESYLDSGDWRGKAGAYGIQTVGDKLIERIEGSFSNVVGLPRELVARMLELAR